MDFSGLANLITQNKKKAFAILALFSAIFLASLFFLFFSLKGSATSSPDEFGKCLSGVPITFYTPNNPDYKPFLEVLVMNLRFNTNETRKPLIIVRPEDENQVTKVVTCAVRHGMHLRIRSGGHDYEGRSYTSEVDFVILDLFNLNSIDISPDGTAWVQAGATNGALYYNIAMNNILKAFPAGVCPTVGIGGHFSGGGSGMLLRKYGLAADHIIDARIVNVDGDILNREQMGEDLFWAMRGGGGSSFGVALAFKIQLVDVPETVTVFKVKRAFTLIKRWQEVMTNPSLTDDLYIRIVVKSVTSTQTTKRQLETSYHAFYLGTTAELVQILEEHFPELQIEAGDCQEMNWIESVLYFAGLQGQELDKLLDRPSTGLSSFKAKSDFATEPVPDAGFVKLRRLIMEEYGAEVIFSPSGGAMDKIDASSIPFPHRRGIVCKIQYLKEWKESGKEESDKHLDWARRVSIAMTPYVSKSPRRAYANYRDLDLGQSKNGTENYAQAKEWGERYFMGNFARLVVVKTTVDPHNFFRNEQSIPVLGSPSQLHASE